MTGPKRKERGRISEDSTNISCKEKKRNREMHIICARFPNEAVWILQPLSHPTPYPAPENSQIGKGISTNRCRKIEGKHHTFLQKASELSPHRASSAYCQVPHLGQEKPYLIFQCSFLMLLARSHTFLQLFLNDFTRKEKVILHFRRQRRQSCTLSYTLSYTLNHQ